MDIRKAENSVVILEMGSKVCDKITVTAKTIVYAAILLLIFITPAAAYGDNSDDVYSNGVKIFKQGDFNRALDIFKSLSEHPSTDTNDAVYIYSLNMTAITYQLSGDSESAVRLFDKLINITEPLVSCKNYFEIFKSASVSSAQLCKLMDNPSLSIKYYQHLLDVIKNKPVSADQAFIAYIYDELAMLNFKIKNYNKYRCFAEILTKNYSSYYRSHLATFELKAMVFLQQHRYDINSINLTEQLPVHLIDYVRKYKPSDINFLEFKVIPTETNTDFGTIAASYQYACLLDILGKSQRAVEIFTAICSANPTGPGSNVAEIIKGYSVIYAAMILSEKNKYNKAIHLLDKNHKLNFSNQHLCKLTDDMLKSLRTVKREGENVQKN